jgi:zinc transport system substrate-binding protein
MRLILIIVVVVAGCGGSSDSEGGRRTVVAGFYPLAFAAEVIAGPAAEVSNLTPPGAEPHDHDLSARDVQRVRDADLVLYFGSGFQPALERAVGSGDGRRLDLLEGLTLLGDAEHADGGFDPHVWLDPLRYAEVSERIGRELGRPRAANAFVRRLRALDREFEAGLAECERREIVTSHAAFGYLADRYGLEQIAITGVSPEAEATPRELEEVVAQVREHGATTVFFETLVSPDLAETVAREVGARTAVLNPIEGLTEEELAGGDDYFSLMRANLEAVRQALGCR